MSDSGAVRYERDGPIAVITFARPSKLNAFNDTMVRAYIEALQAFDDDPESRVAIIHGEGRAFSSGADVRERHLRDPDELKRLGGPEGRGASARGVLFRQVNWKPVVAAVHGYALGLGLMLVLECDLAVATHDTQFQVTEVPRGVWGSRFVAMLAHRGAGAFGDEVVLTGRYFSGEEAARHNVICRSVSDGDHLGAARQLADRLAALPPLAVRAAVRARRWYLEKYEAEEPLLRSSFALHLTADFRESATAFAEGRSTRPFTGE
jgi:enoyl-CoA hydratase/carnithine racemase